MQEANFSYYPLDLADVWDYERLKFLSGETNLEFAQKFRLTCQDIITRKGKRSLNVSLERDKSHTDEYLNHVIERYVACRTEEDHYRLEYFLSGYDSYSYIQNIIIDQEEVAFDLFFSLKLNQYQHKLISVDDFLQYHLKHDFQNSLDEFSDYLTLIIRQNIPLFSESLIQTVTDWKNNFHNAKIRKPQRSNKTEIKKPISEFNSFTLKSFAKNKNYFVDHVQEVLEIISLLKENKFFHSDTRFEQFKYLFQNSKQLATDPITWVGSNVELQWFIKILIYDLKLVDDVKNDKWLMTIKCFRKKNGSNFSTEELIKATGNKLLRQELLKSILERL